jgi:receptor expression-enhancing protein 1/2/3/4
MLHSSASDHDGRIPFYYPTKTIFLLYLALPQTRGSSYLYRMHLQPFFHTYEPQIDAALASIKVRVYTFVQDRLRALWEHVTAVIGQQQQVAPQPPTAAAADSSSASSSADSGYSPAQLASNLWRSYGPGIVAAGTNLLRQSAIAAANARTEALFNAPASVPPPPPSLARSDTTQSILERKRQLEAELAALSALAPEHSNAGMAETAAPVSPMPGVTPGAPFTSSRGSSDSDLRERNVSGGRFEEIEVPSDVEGYKDSGSESSSGRLGAMRRTSWFGWGLGTQDNERVKSE